MHNENMNASYIVDIAESHTKASLGSEECVVNAGPCILVNSLTICICTPTNYQCRKVRPYLVGNREQEENT